MIYQEFERSPFWQLIADIMEWLLTIFKPIVYPIGLVMVLWIDFLLRFFPSENITIYIVIFCVLVICGIIVNTKWPGEKYVSVFTKEEETDDSEKKSTNIEHLEKKRTMNDKKEADEL